MSADSLDLIWRCCDVPEPVLTENGLDEIDSINRELLNRLGFLKTGATTRFATCPDCGHVDEYEVLPNASDVKSIFIACPEHGRVEVDCESLMQTTISFQSFVDLLVGDLNTRDDPQEVVPGRLWNLGRAALAGQSRPVWLVRGLCLADVRGWEDKLPTGKSPILFIAGTMPSPSLYTLSPRQVVELRSVVFLDEGELMLDVDAVRDHLAGEAPSELKKKPPRKRGKRGSIIDALKRELHQYILNMKSRIRVAEDTNELFELPHLTQKSLAVLIEDNETNVSRALNDPNEKELPIIYEIANSIEMIRKYSR